jgi:hypothetical protein
MSVRNASAIAILSVVLLGGCPFCANVGLPTEIPPEVLTVQSDTERFSPSDHPLADVTVGTVIDDPASLDGCWARYNSRTFTSEDGPDLEFVEILVFDIGAGTFIQHQLAVGELQLAEGEAFLTTTTGDLRLESDRRMIMEVTAAGGAIVSEGELRSNASTQLRASLECGASSSWVFTIDGDYMSRRLGLIQIEQGLFTAEEAGLEMQHFVRLECASE